MALEPLGITAVAAGVPGFVRNMGRMDKSIQRVGKSAGELSGGFQTLAGTVVKGAAIMGAAVAGAAVGAGAAIVKLAVDAAPLEGIATSFDNLAEAAGKGGPAMLEALQRGSAGLATNRDLMTSFNKAAALVGNDFAVQLPDAMQFLGRVAQSTGQDLGFLLDSLVVGVGRLSPMILDNLGIQVALSDATAKAAEMFGVQESELTKTQQQAGLMAVVMEKLEVSTAALPDVAGSAAQSFGQFGIMLQNLRDEIGLALLPSFVRIADALAPVIQNILPRLVELFESRVAPAIDLVADFIEKLIDLFTGPAKGAFTDTATAIAFAFASMFPADIANKIFSNFRKIREGFNRVKELIVDNKDDIVTAITAIGTAFGGAVLLGSVLKFASILAKLTSPIGLLILLASALKLAWDTNFLGIRDTLTEFWEDTLQPIVENIREWLGEKLPPVIDKVKEFFADLFGGEGQGAITKFKDALQPLIDRFQPFLEDLGVALGELKTTFMESWPEIQAAIAEVGEFIKTNIVPVFKVSFEFILRTVENVITIVTKLIGGLTDFWKKNGSTIIGIVKATFKSIASIISGIVSLITGIVSGFTALLAGDFDQAFENILGGIGGFFESILSLVDTNLGEFLSTWTGVFDNLGVIVSTALKNVITGILDFGEDLLSALEDSVVGQAVGGLLDLLGVGSPSRLMESVGADMMQGLARGIAQGVGMPTLAMAGVGAAAVPAAAQTINMEFNQNIETRAETEPVAADFQQMVAQAENVSRRF